MAERIPQSVSYLVVFRAFLASDGKTPATGKTIAVTISKNGGAFGNPNAGATNATEISSGFYKVTLDATDTGTLGPLAWRGAQADINDAGDVLTVAAAPATQASVDDLPTNAELATALGTADDAVLAAVAALSIPSAAANATAVRSELTTELARIDVGIGTRLATAGYTAPPSAATIAAAVEAAILNEGDATALLATIAAKVEEFLINEGDAAATLAAIAAAVRTNLAAELARIDVGIGTRLATAGYTAPPSAAAVATQVRTELTVELAKVGSMTFTVANVIDANVRRVNDVAVTGTGAVGDEWGS